MSSDVRAFELADLPRRPRKGPAKLEATDVWRFSDQEEEWIVIRNVGGYGAKSVGIEVVRGNWTLLRPGREAQIEVGREAGWQCTRPLNPAQDATIRVRWFDDWSQAYLEEVIEVSAKDPWWGIGRRPGGAPNYAAAEDELDD